MRTIISCKAVSIKSNTQIHNNNKMCSYYVDHNNNTCFYHMACNLQQYSVANSRTKKEGVIFQTMKTMKTNKLSTQYLQKNNKVLFYQRS